MEKIMTVKTSAVSSAFLWRRIHSLMGFWLVIYLVEHLIVNSQAALWIGDDGHAFVRLVNSLESLPFLQVIEVALIGIPLALHAGWGIKRALSAKMNAGSSDGGSPSLKYERNRAYSWQRISSWILLFGILFHVIEMRFLDYPKKVVKENQEQYLVAIDFDEGLYSLSSRLKAVLYSPQQISEMMHQMEKESSLPLEKKSFSEAVQSTEYLPAKESEVEQLQRAAQEKKWIEQLASFHLEGNQVVAVCPKPGTAMLLSVRDTFKSPLMAVLYTLFVLAAAFHACNGFWTFLITWGWILSMRSQKAMIPMSLLGMLFLSFLGLAAIWGSYWINLRY
jgi:succinate dehydrogenase / fumarate reductase cytochrome b subunit